MSAAGVGARMKGCSGMYADGMTGGLRFGHAGGI